MDLRTPGSTLPHTIEDWCWRSPVVVLLKSHQQQHQQHQQNRQSQQHQRQAQCLLRNPPLRLCLRLTLMYRGGASYKVWFAIMAISLGHPTDQSFSLSHHFLNPKHVKLYIVRYWTSRYVLTKPRSLKGYCFSI